MNTERELIKSSWLQQKVCRVSGTLLRKKKVHYEEAEWVVLCVHNKRIPLLEWYFSEGSVQEHRPVRVVDLLDAAFVSSVISDTRCFTVGFTHPSTEALELSALTPEDCQEWIQKATTTLIRLNCFGDSSNIYSALPEIPSASSTSAGVDEDVRCSLDDDVPRIMAPILTDDDALQAAYERLSVIPPGPTTQQTAQASPTFTVISPDPMQQVLSPRKQSADRDIPPPLPPRRLTSIPSPVSLSPNPNVNSTYDFPKNFVPAPAESAEESPTVVPDAVPASRCSTQSSSRLASNEYGSLAESPSPLSTEIAPPPDPVRLALIKRGYSVPRPSPPARLSESDTGVRSPAYDSLNAPQHRYDFPVFSENPSDVASTSVHKVERTHSSSVAPIGLHSKSERRSADGFFRANKSFLSNLDLTLDQHVKKPIKIALQLKICLQHIAFVDFSNKVWIGGWSQTAEKHLSGMIHVGDEVMQIADSKVENVAQLLSVLQKVSSLAAPIDLTLRQVPYGKEFVFTKDARCYNIGVVLQKHKNKIEAVRDGSQAFKAGIRPRMTACTHQGTTPAFISQLNGRQLNLFSKNDEFLLKLKEVPLFTRFTIVILPYDFVKMVKKSLRKLKNSSDFVST